MHLMGARHYCTTVRSAITVTSNDDDSNNDDINGNGSGDYDSGDDDGTTDTLRLSSAILIHRLGAVTLVIVVAIASTVVAFLSLTLYNGLSL